MASTANTNKPDHVPSDCVIAGLPYWHATEEYPSKPLPNRDEATKEIFFEDYPSFRPNLTPKQVLQAGAFGGTYFRSIESQTAKKKFKEGVHLEFPSDLFTGLDASKHLNSMVYRKEVNRYGVKSGNDLEFWEAKGWMRPQDPYGWFQWYCRFYLGRRTEDDERQVSRWVKAIGPKGRWRTFLVGQCVKQGKAWDDHSASPVTRQTLLHWGYELTSDEFDRLAGPIRQGKNVIYMGQVVTKSGTGTTHQQSTEAATRKSKRKRKR